MKNSFHFDYIQIRGSRPRFTAASTRISDKINQHLQRTIVPPASFHTKLTAVSSTYKTGHTVFVAGGLHRLAVVVCIVAK